MRAILQPILAEALARLSEWPDSEAVNNLALKLAEHHDTAKASGTLAEFKSACQDHPIAKIILEDPYVRRAFDKPRGYAGDAVMLDFIYKPGQVNASPLGCHTCRDDRASECTEHNLEEGLPRAQNSSCHGEKANSPSLFRRKRTHAGD